MSIFPDYLKNFNKQQDNCLALINGIPKLKIELPHKTALLHWDICTKDLKSGLQDVFIPTSIAAFVTILQV